MCALVRWEEGVKLADAGGEVKGVGTFLLSVTRVSGIALERVGWKGKLTGAAPAARRRRLRRRRGRRPAAGAAADAPV